MYYKQCPQFPCTSQLSDDDDDNMGGLQQWLSESDDDDMGSQVGGGSKVRLIR